MKIQLFINSYSYKKLLGTLVPNCKRCGGERLRKDGKYRRYQMYKCTDCGYRFSYSSDLPRRRFKSRIIEFAVNLYVSTGVSYRVLAKKVYQFFGVKVSYRTILNWTKDFPIPEADVKLDGSWNIDETAIKVKGTIHWLWFVMNYESRQIISWHLSKARTLIDAKKVIHEARMKTQRPEEVFTDKLPAYKRVIKKEFGWRQNPHEETKNAAFGPNSRIERLNREVKRRIKWFSTFQNTERAKNFIQNWVNQYNTEKFT